LYLAKALSLGLRLTANMIGYLISIICLIFLLININGFLHLNTVDITDLIISLSLFSAFLLNKSINLDILNNLSKKGYPSSQVYFNADTDKLDIIKDNKGKTGIYLWTHISSGKTYVGSSIDLSKRLNSYYSLSYLTRRNKSYICNALSHHGYSAFSFTILEYIDLTGLSKDQIRKFILEREQHYINEIAPEPQGARSPLF
jgi:hypothetical protein